MVFQNCWRVKNAAYTVFSLLQFFKCSLQSTASACCIYGADERTREHALLHCTMFKCSWALLDEELMDMLTGLRFTDSIHLGIPHM